MSTSLSVIGFRQPDEEFNKKLAAYRACEAADIEIPEDLQDYFDDELPSEHGLRVELPTTEYSGQWEYGYEINVSDIPKNITVIRVVMSS